LLAHLIELLEALNCGAALLDRTGAFVYLNQRLGQMMQRDPVALRGRLVIDFYDDLTDRAMLADRLAHFGTSSEMEFYLPLPDGTRLPVITSSRALPGEQYRLVTLIDISKQKEAERTMRDHYEFIVKMSDTVLKQALDLKHYSSDLEIRVQERTAELHAANMDAIYMLAEAAEAKDQDTGRHVRRIQTYSRVLALQLKLPESHAQEIGYSSILHDVGKLHIPDRILAKPGPLDRDERVEMQSHTLVGERILSPREFFAMARSIARSHHENWDGSGYPDQLKGEAIPLAARIVHIVDVYDALINPRCYKDPWENDRAMAFIADEAGRMFDPEITAAFLALVGEPHALSR
jgi:response regulator RpfG family c-di-GMP phosphodiesterase